MITKERVVALGNRLGFEIVKICSAEPFVGYEKTVKERLKTKLYPKDLISHEKILENVKTYADPSNSLPNAKSIISMVFCYYSLEPTDLTKPGEPHGVLARAYQKYVYGEMYRRRKEFVMLLCKKGVKVAEKTLFLTKWLQPEQALDSREKLFDSNRKVWIMDYAQQPCCRCGF